MSNEEKPAEPGRARGKEGLLRQLAKAFIYCLLIRETNPTTYSATERAASLRDGPPCRVSSRLGQPHQDFHLPSIIIFYILICENEKFQIWKI